MRFARKLELPCSARSYCSLWRTLAAAPGSGGVCPDAGAANSKSNEAINIVDERLAIVPSLAIYANKLASKPIWLIPAVGSDDRLIRRLVQRQIAQDAVETVFD